MGYEIVRLEASACVSRHNSPRDDEHNELWNEFLWKVRRAAGEVSQEGLQIELLGAEDLPVHEYNEC